MNANRNIQVLTKGLQAAHRQLFRQDELRKGEYEHSLLSLYSKLEDALYTLYSAIQQGQRKRTVHSAGDVIALASMVAEVAGELMGQPGASEEDE
jgi:hypothetical protein